MLKRSLAVLAGILFSASVFALDADDLRPDHPDSYTVVEGDTLWSIAQRFHGSTSQVGYVDALVSAVGEGPLQVGQVITLP